MSPCSLPRSVPILTLSQRWLPLLFRSSKRRSWSLEQESYFRLQNKHVRGGFRFGEGAVTLKKVQRIISLHLLKFPEPTLLFRRPVSVPHLLKRVDRIHNALRRDA